MVTMAMPMHEATLSQAVLMLVGRKYSAYSSGEIVPSSAFSLHTRRCSKGLLSSGMHVNLMAT